MRMIALLCGVALLAAPAAAAPDAATARRIERILAATPLIDGHNDLPWELRKAFDPRAGYPDIAAGTDKLVPPLDTDIARMRAGHMGAQFWSVWIPAATTGAEAIKTTIEQIDIVHEMVRRHPRDLELASTAADIVRIHKAKRIASLIGVEGGHQIGNSLAALRQYYALGARYMTLTHAIANDWADSATADPVHHGLTPFGQAVVLEMNRIGMMVDLAHVSPETMKAALGVSRAPVIFSHSGARGVVDHPRNVPDDVLALVKANGGVVMANFYPAYASAEAMRWNADRAAEVARTNAPPFGGMYIGQPERAAAAIAAWEAAHPMPAVTVAQIADHIEHIVKIAGHDHVGIGSDFDGIPNTPQGLAGVQDFPNLIAELIRRGWSDADLAKLAGGNLLRVMRAVEAVAAKSADMPASIATIATLDAPAK